MARWGTLGGVVSALLLYQGSPGVLSGPRSGNARGALARPAPTATGTPLPRIDFDADALALSMRPPLSAPTSPNTSCRDGMVLVSGEYCPVVQHTCKRYLTPYGRFAKYRCAEYDTPRCLSKRRRSMSFCIDRNEYTAPGEKLPSNHKSLVQAGQICESLGKRACTESEWNFACEGEEMRPYPYGFKREARTCNADRTDILTPGRALKDLRAPSDAFPACVSPFGVHNMTGNLEEFVVKDGSDPSKAVMKGAYWQPSRNTCRARQTVHGPGYSGLETGFRCCSAPRPSVTQE